MNIRYMCKLALGSRNDENSVLTFFQTFRINEYINFNKTKPKRIVRILSKTKIKHE